MLTIINISIADNSPIEVCAKMLIFELPLPVGAVRFWRIYLVSDEILILHRNLVRWLGYKYFIPQYSARTRLSAHWIPDVANSNILCLFSSLNKQHRKRVTK